MELTQAERQRIYEEEKARAEAKQQIQQEQQAEKLKAQQQSAKGCLGCITVVVGFCFLPLFATCGSSSPTETASSDTSYESSATDSDLYSTASNLVSGYETNGILKELDCKQYHAVISRNFWTLMDYKSKKTFTASLSVYCNRETGSNTIKILDHMSHTELGGVNFAGFYVK